MLLFSLFCWIIFTLALAFIQPPAHSCISSNETHTILETPRFKRSLVYSETYFPTDLDEFYQEVQPSNFDDEDFDELERDKRDIKKPLPGPAGLSPYPLDHTKIANRNEGETTGLVHPSFSSVVYESKAVAETFLLLLLLVVIGEFFSAPAITLADSATLGYLGDDSENYGKQRMFGSLGWGLAMFFVGIALDHATTFPDHPCNNVAVGEKNYTICFAVFSVLMAFAWISATQFTFQYDNNSESIPLGNLGKLTKKVTSKIKEKVLGIPSIPKQKLINEESDTEDHLYNQQKPNGDAQKDGYLPQDPNDPNHKLEINVTDRKENMVSDVSGQGNVFNAEGETLPKWITVLKMFGTVRYGSFLYVAWFMGFGIGLVFTFLFWHLQDLGGSPTLFGIASVINHVSEIVAYFFSNRLIRYLGHVKVLYIGLAGNVARFLYISWLKNPWWVLPFEFVQGLTHAAVWAACCSYITQAIPPNLRSSAQGILQGIHHGLGRGCGAILGGVFVTYFGSEMTFRGYGFACLIVLLLFFGINYFIKEQAPQSDPHAADEPTEVLEETAHLAPCGVPMNPMSRNLSSSRLSELADQSKPVYGATTTTADGFLNPNGGGVQAPARTLTNKNGQQPTSTPQPQPQPVVQQRPKSQQPVFNNQYGSQPVQSSGGYQEPVQGGGGYGGFQEHPRRDGGYGSYPEQEPQRQQPQQKYAQDPQGQGYGYGQGQPQQSFPRQPSLEREREREQRGSQQGFPRQPSQERTSRADRGYPGEEQGYSKQSSAERHHRPPSAERQGYPGQQRQRSVEREGREGHYGHQRQESMGGQRHQRGSSERPEHPRRDSAGRAVVTNPLARPGDRKQKQQTGYGYDKAPEDDPRSRGGYQY